MEVVRPCIEAVRDKSTDLGPQFDHEAFENIQKQLQKLNSASNVLVAPVIRVHAAIYLIAKDIPGLINPTIIEVSSLADVREEIFGPVVQIVRWSGDTMCPVDEINPLGYGLTLGIHTRTDSRAQAPASHAHVGNVYVNRNMIGAGVGVQPFGGEDLNSTSPRRVGRITCTGPVRSRR